MSLLYERVLKMLPKINTILTFYTETQIKDIISSTQHKLQYNIGFAMQDNAAQQWWYTGSEHNFKYCLIRQNGTSRFFG